MNDFEHDNPGQSVFQGSDLAALRVNNGSDDENVDHLDKQRLGKELLMKLNEEFNESGADISVISSSHCSNTSEENTGEDELESHSSHVSATNKSKVFSKKKRVPTHSNPTYQNVHLVNKIIQPDFIKDGSYPSPIPQCTPQFKGDKHLKYNDATKHVSKDSVYFDEELSNEANYETSQTLNEMRQNRIKLLERELFDTQMKGKTEIGELHEKLLDNESEYQKRIAEYQHQCESLNNKNNYLEEQNLLLRQRVETSEKANSKLTKELDNIRLNMINLEQQLTNLSRDNGSKQYDTNVDFIISDLKKKHSQEVAVLQDQYKTVVAQLKSKEERCTFLKNELKKLQQDHHNAIKAGNEKLRSDLSVLHNVADRRGITTDVGKLEEDYQKNLGLLKKQREDVRKLTELIGAKDRSIAEMEKKEVTYKHCMHKIQEELEKHSRDRSHKSENSNNDCEILKNVIEMQLEDTMCKLIRTEEDMSNVSDDNCEKNKQLSNNNSIEEYVRYHQISLENVVKQKDEEIKKLRNRMEEYVKEIDQLKQLYIKVCSEKDHCLSENEKLEKHLADLSGQFETLDKQYGSVIKEKEELAITLVGLQKEMNANQDPLQKQLMEREIEKLNNELLVHKRQKEMIAQLKIDLAQSKERVLSLEQRLQSECDSKVANYANQLEKLKQQYDEKVKELNQAKDTISKFNNLDLQTSVTVNNEEKTLKSKLYDYENSLATIQRKHKLALNEITFKYKNELHELEMLYNKKCNEEKVLCAKIIEELKSKHKIEMDTLNTAAKQNTDEYANQELIRMIAEQKQQFEKAKDILMSKNNTIKELETKLENAKMDISIRDCQLEQLKDVRASSTDVEKLGQQIEEERTKFGQIMTNWAHEMRQMKDKLSTTIDEREKLQLKYAKVKHAALGYKHSNQKQQVVYNDLLGNCIRFLDELKTKTDRLLTHRENEIQTALKDFEDECRQRRLAFSDVHKSSSFNIS